MGDKLRLLVQNRRAVLIIFLLNNVAMFLFIIGFTLGQLDPEIRKHNHIQVLDEAYNSVRHLRFDRYFLVGMAIAVIVVLAALMPKRVSNWANGFSLASTQISGIPVGLLVMPGLFIVLDSPPSASSFIPILLGSLILLISSLIPFFSRDSQEYAIRVYNRFGAVAPTLFAAMVALFALILFSWVGLFLSVRGWVSISGTDGLKKGDLGFYIVAFGYETAKAMPVVDLSDVFQWKAPYNHSGFTSGMLILMFRIAVLAPIIAFYGAYWRHVRERREVRPTARQEATTVADETVSATTIINAPAGAIFAVLAEPANHGAIDGTGWVCKPLDSQRLTAQGQVFRMTMYHPNHPDGNYQTANRVQVFDPPRAISWEPGYDSGDGSLRFGGWVWRYDLAPAVPSGTKVTLSYDWSAVGDGPRQRIQFPPFSPDHLDNSLAHLADLVTA